MTASPDMSLVEHRVTVPNEHEIIRIRDLSAEEAKRIGDAADLIFSVATSRCFRRIQALTQLASAQVELVEARDQPSQHEIESCRAVIRGLVQAHEEFASDGLPLLAARQVDEARSALAELAGSPPRQELAALDEQGARLAFDREHNLGILRENRLAALAQLIAGAYTECEEAFGQLLRAIGPDVVEAGRLLRILHAECPQGIPALLELISSGA